MAVKTDKKKKRRRARHSYKPLFIAAAIVLLLAAGFIIYLALKPDYELENKDDPVATIELSNGEKVIVELFPDCAPATVNNFTVLANNGFYDGMSFHKIVPGERVQTGKGEGGQPIKGEFSLNGHDNPLSHTRGTLSMARLTGYDSAVSEFFICLGDMSYIDTAYAAFGRVVKGMEHIDSIASGKNIHIKTIRVDAKEFVYQATEE